MDQEKLSQNKQFLHPKALCWRDWKIILPRVTHNLFSGSTTLMAAGCAFYCTLALFPAISALISIYGLAFNIRTITPQMIVLQNLLPAPAFTLIQERVQTLVNEPHTSLTFNLVLSLIIALWSASAATRSLIYALNSTYKTDETRNFFIFHITAFFLTFIVVIGAVLTIALMVAAPLLFHMISELHIPVGIPIDAISLLTHLTHWSSFIVLFIFETLVLSGLYNFGPNRPRRNSWCWTMPGAILATLIWILTSQVFSYYVAHLADYNSTYGPLGTVIAIMMWFFITAWVVLMGAEINVNIESYTHNKPLPSRHY